MAKQSLLYRYNTANIAIKLIVVNVLVYIIFNLIPWFLQTDFFLVKKFFVLPNDVWQFVQQPWSVFTYGFIHASFRHILWNMVGLYVVSRFVLNLFSEKRLLTLYLLGAASGGLLFFTLSNILPVLGERSYLVGASAAVAAVLVFMGTYTPNAEVRVFTFNIKLWHIAVAFVVINVLSLPSSDNAGGLVSHLGGAAFGYVYAKQLLKGNDIGLWFEKLLDSVSSWFTKTPQRKRKSPLRTVHKNKATATTKTSSPSSVSKSQKQQKIDGILDKISKSGYDSLTKDEKDFLFKAGNE